jgi:hypothetical protein
MTIKDMFKDTWVDWIIQWVTSPLFWISTLVIVFLCIVFFGIPLWLRL